MVKAPSILKPWWNEELVHIQPELSRMDELKKMFAIHMRAIDAAVAACIDTHSLKALLICPLLRSWVDKMCAAVVQADSSLLCTDLACAFSANDQAALAELEGKVVLKLFDSDLVGANDIAKVISSWANHERTNKHDAPNGLVCSFAGVISARRMPILPWALSAVTEISETNPRRIGSSCYALLNVGLKIMLSELRCDAQPDGTGIPDDSVPVLRLGCLKLSRALRDSPFYKPADACGLWLLEALNDPLPDLRFL